MKKAMIVQVIVNVVNKDGEGDSAPKLLDIGLRVCSMLTYCIDNFGVGMFCGPTDVHTEQCCGRDVHESPLGSTIESTNESDGDTVAVNEPCLGSIDPCCLSELHRQDLALGDSPLILDARKLTNAESAVIVDDRAFGSQTPQRSSSAAKVSKVCCRFGVGLDRPTSRHQHRQLNQRRCGSPSLSVRTLENAVLILKSKRPHAIDIIDRQEQVDRGERLVVLRLSGRSSCCAALGVITENDATRPAVRFGIGYGAMKYRCIAGWLVK